MQLTPSININMNNQGMIALILIEETKQLKHIDVQFHHTHDSQAQGLIAINSIQLNDNPADGLTKILRSNLFSQFFQLINMKADDDVAYRHGIPARRTRPTRTQPGLGRVGLASAKTRNPAG